MSVDHFNAHAQGLSSPATKHFTLVASDANDLAVIPRAVYVNVGGVAVIRDVAGTEIAYNVNQGQVLPFRGVRLLSTGTTATLIGWE
ncbi:hypothetical protein A1351_15575 [Methylosinus sp. R-45379]|uniref:spike base protein, RCAP_Rcc01079 family n=1 Tax=Methylosinus sp. R-45379 TaxID=980563 RepID=UPI0007C91D47|nr:hypothetical protein [Methylosinus sp. R-45379]OAI25971.1 hypothetical protein A1351_15575 [Methylosinus sp. R-45379]